MLREEGIEFLTSTHVGQDVSIEVRKGLHGQREEGRLRAGWLLAGSPSSRIGAAAAETRTPNTHACPPARKPTVHMHFQSDQPNKQDLRANSDALVLTVGSTVPRDLRIPNRDAKGWVGVYVYVCV